MLTRSYYTLQHRLPYAEPNYQVLSQVKSLEQIISADCIVSVLVLFLQLCFLLLPFPCLTITLFPSILVFLLLLGQLLNALTAIT